MELIDLSRDYCKGPTLIGQNLWKSNESGSGCSVLDIKFPQVIKIAGISFKNHYTAKLQIWMKYRMKIKSIGKSKTDQQYVWMAAVPKMVLMPHPHFEKGGSENFMILHPSSHYVTAMRVVLKQPSFQWQNFFIYQLSIFQEIPPHFRSLLPFLDAQSKQQLEDLKLLEQQTKKYLSKPEYENEDAESDDDTDGTNSEVYYKILLLPSTDS